MEKLAPKLENSSLDNLKEQFDYKETLTVNGQQIEIVDIKPPESKTDIPVIIAPGWLATSELLKENILHLAGLGRRTISLNSAHGVDRIDGAEDDKIREKGDFPEAELRKTMALLKVMEEKKINQVDAVGHSEAGIYLTIAATLFPERFRNLVLVDPAGIIGKDNFFQLAKRFSADLITEFKKWREDYEKMSIIKNKAQHGARSIFASPKKALEEVLAISRTQVTDLLKELKEKGIGISIIHAVGDKAFPMDRVQENISQENVDCFYSVKGTHNELILNPEVYTKLVDSALSNLEKREGAE